MSEELKPCPFCGADEGWLSIEHMEGTIRHPAYCVRCENCGASSSYTDHNCRELWNERASHWLAIETAPKDSLIDLWNGFRYTSCGWAIPNYHEEEDSDYCWCERRSDESNFDEYWFEIEPQPTHWMSIPEPPK